MKTETYRNLNIAILVINVILMAYLVNLIVPNIDKAEHDPLNYGSRLYNIKYCSCFTNENKPFFFNETNIWVINQNTNQNQVLTFNKIRLEELLKKE